MEDVELLGCCDWEIYYVLEAFEVGFEFVVFFGVEENVWRCVRSWGVRIFVFLNRIRKQFKFIQKFFLLIYFVLYLQRLLY